MNLILKIILLIAATFYGLIILFLGVAAFYGLKEAGMEPLETVNKFIIYWLVTDLLIRYFLQKSPVMHIKPLLTLPIKRGKIISFLLGKSAFSIFNLYPAFFFLPFTIVLLINGYSTIGVIAWHMAILSLIYAHNYLILLINNVNWVFILIAIILISFGLLQYFGVLDVTAYTGSMFQEFYALPVLGLAIIVLPVIFYRLCYLFFKNKLRLDDAVQKKEEIVRTEHFSWLEKYGIMGNFLKNDIKLIKRNKRSKTTVWMSILFLFYGLLIMTNAAYSAPAWKLFSGLFVTGGFLFTFGGFVPSWDSAYYPLMMSQNIQYKEYIASKWWLIVIATFLSIILASFYLFLGWDFYLAILVGGIYNIGVNAHIVLLGGAYVKTPIDLTSGKKAFGDKKAFNLKTLLITLPKLALPLIVFYIFYKIWDIRIGYLAVAILGVLGLAFRNKMFSMIEKVYKKEKYATLLAYKEKK